MTKYFETLPNVNYSFKIGDTVNQVTVKSINTKVSFTDLTLDTTENFYLYDTELGERLDLISNFYYKDVDRFWIVMMSNQATDMLSDFSMSQNTFDRFIVRKYKQDSIDSGNGSTDKDVITYTQSTVHQYYDSDGFAIDKTTYDALSPLERSNISLYDHETQVNDDKRQIRLASNAYVTNIERQFKDLMKVKGD